MLSAQKYGKNLPVNYSPFGAILYGRNWSSEEYRYGFNGMEKDDELKGSGSSYDFGARMYDSRLGKWLSVDALVDKYPYSSPYCFVLNKPIIAVDPDGNIVKIVVQKGFLGIGRKTVQVKFDDENQCQLKLDNSVKLNEKQEKFAKQVLNSMQNHIDKPISANEMQELINDENNEVKVKKAKNHKYNPNTNTVLFNPTLGGYVFGDKDPKDGLFKIVGAQSPAEIMAGEFYHAHGEIYDEEGYNERIDNSQEDKEFIQTWGSREEKRVIEEYDQKVLGQDRKNHDGATVTVKDELTRPPMKKKGKI